MRDANTIAHAVLNLVVDGEILEVQFWQRRCDAPRYAIKHDDLICLSQSAVDEINGRIQADIARKAYHAAMDKIPPAEKAATDAEKYAAELQDRLYSLYADAFYEYDPGGLNTERQKRLKAVARAEYDEAVITHRKAVEDAAAKIEAFRQIERHAQDAFNRFWNAAGDLEGAGPL